MRKPSRKDCQYLGEGIGKVAYLLPDGRVLKEDLPYRAGCAHEVEFYDRVADEAPHLLVHLATIYAHGDGWLVQQYVPITFAEDDVCTTTHYGYNPCDCVDLRIHTVARKFKEAGFPLNDIHAGNYGRLTPNGWPEVFDLDWCGRA